MRLLFPTLFSVFVIVFALPPGVAGDTMFRASPEHAGVFSDGGSPPDNVLSWSFDEQNHRITSPAAAGGIVYFGSEDHNLYALYAANGTEKWRFAAGDMIRSAPAIADDTVFFGSTDGYIYALHAANGSVRWQVATGAGYDGVGYSSPAVSGGTVYIVSYDRNLYAIDAASGSVRWKFPFVSPMGSETESSPAVSGGVVYFGDVNRVVYAVWTANGTEKWRYVQSGTFMATIPPAAPVVSDGVLYMSGPGNRNLTVHWAENGTEKTRLSLGYANWPLVAPAVKDGILYTGGTDQYLHAIETGNGNTAWSFYLGSLLRASPSVSGDTVYAGSLGKVLSAIHAGNGTEKWRFSPPNGKGLWGAPVVADGLVLIDGDSADHLYALGNTGTPPKYFTGRVRAGDPGNTTGIGLRDLPVRLYGSDTADSPGTFISGTVTDSYGYYLLPLPDGTYQFLSLVHEDTVPGSTPAGAQSDEGTVVNATWIRYSSPFGGYNLSGNYFWDTVPTVHGDFSAAPLSGPAPLTVTFTDNSTGYPVTWNWIHEYNTTIGNGPVTGLSANTTYTYAEPGVYSVQMRIFNAVSSDWVTRPGLITVTAPHSLVPLPGFSDPPTDPDTDGIFEDLNANGELDFNDVFVFFRQIEWMEENEPLTPFDLNGNGALDFNDVFLLFREVQ